MTSIHPAAPWIHRLNEVPDVANVLRRLSDLPHCLLLDSAMAHPTLGRYSFIAADPVKVFVATDTTHHVLSEVEAALAGFETVATPGLPPFQGGAAGLLSYELGGSFERVPLAPHDEFQCPLAVIGIYDVVMAIDHQASAAWVISQGYPEQDLVARAERAERRGQQFVERLSMPLPEGLHHNADWRRPFFQPKLTLEELAPQHQVQGVARLSSDFTATQYQEFVARAVEYIYAGDIFQVNLSQRFLHPAVEDSLSLYERLRRCNPATFAAYFDTGGFQVLSASPERFVSIRDGRVETRPIKGTRRRLLQPEADLYSATDLSNSEKDRSENVMIVDLLRNDLSRVCRPDSITVTQLCELEQYEFVQHLVSAVQGELASDCHPLDLIRAAFPGGSITGAPKVRAMEIIADLEPTARGPYCGSLGYLGFDGAMDWSILIRTITAGRGWWQMPAGGGIVADSQPMAEYQETLDKARGMIRAL